MQSPTEAITAETRSEPATIGKTRSQLSRDVAPEVVVGHPVADEEQQLRAEREDEHRARQRRELRDRVVEPRDGPGEVEGERAVALVAADELGRDGRAEEDEDDPHVGEVVLVLEELDRSGRSR